MTPVTSPQTSSKAVPSPCPGKGLLPSPPPPDFWQSLMMAGTAIATVPAPKRGPPPH